MKSNRSPFLWLAIGGALMLFANGRWTVPLATWLYPIFYLRFMRLKKPVQGFVFIFLFSAVVTSIAWWKMIPAPPVVYFILTGLALQLILFSFLADRLIATQISGFTSTLVFPVSWCTIEYLMSLIPSKGSWVALAYTQPTNLAIMQLISVTGIWGVSFLITWFASVVNWIWAKNFARKKIRVGAISFAGIMAAVFLFGALQQNPGPSLLRKVRTASIVQSRNINADIKTCRWTDAQGIATYSNEVEDNLLTKTKEAADAGAKIILWQESAGFIPKLREGNFIKRAMALASDKKIYLLMTLWAIPEDFPKHLVENKIIVINPAGTQQLIYFKSNPVPVEPIVKGDGHIPVLQTAYGKIAVAICFDDAFPNFIRQAGKNEVELMFIPANDWKEVDPIHTRMAITRAIENGFSLVRPAGQGLSAVTDNRGRILSSMDFFTSSEQIMYADVPVNHSNTVYSHIGDLFAWACILATITFILGATLKPRAIVKQEIKYTV